MNRRALSSYWSRTGQKFQLLSDLDFEADQFISKDGGVTTISLRKIKKSDSLLPFNYFACYTLIFSLAVNLSRTKISPTEGGGGVTTISAGFY